MSFVVEDAPCLGACGLGSMVSIEYQDGDYDLVTGLDETLQAVGITKEGTKEEADTMDSSIQGSSVGDILPAQRKVDENSDQSKDASVSLIEGESFIVKQDATKKLEEPFDAQQTMSKELNKQNEVEDDHGAVKRMREESKSQNGEENINPWMNMALYIGKKVTDSVLK